MPKQYRAAVQGCLKFSPLWDAESVVFNPESTEIFVVTDVAARLLRAIQGHAAPVSVSDLVTELATDPRIAAQGDVQEEVEAMLVELERLGLVDSAAP